MKRWRSFLVFLLILTLVFSLAAALSGCAKSDVSDGSGDSGTSEGPGNSDGSDGADDTSSSDSGSAGYRLSAQSFTVETEHLAYCDQDVAPNQDLATGEIQYLLLAEDGRKDFSALDEVLQKQKETLIADGIDRVAEFGQSALEWEDYKREDFYPYSSNVFVSIIRADSQMLSYLLEWNEYCGGVHPSSYYEGFNLDVKTGASISLDQVVSDIPALKALVMEKLLAEYGEDGFYADLDALLADYFAWDEEAEIYRPSWTLSEESLTISFSPYEIAPYAAGLLQAEIRFDEAPELFTGAYLPQAAPGK